MRLWRTVWARTLLFSICTLVPLLLAGAWAFSWSQQTLLDQIVAVNQAQARAGAERLESELNKLTRLESELLFDTDVNRLGVMPGYYTRPQSAPAMLRVADRMHLLADSSPLAADAAFLSPAIGKAIYDTGVENLDAEFYAQISARAIERPRKLILMDDDYYLCMAYPSYYTYLKARGAMYVLAVRLDNQALENMLDGLRAREDECVFLYEGGMRVSRAGDMEFDLASAVGPVFDADGARGVKYVGVRVQSGELTLVKLLPKARIFASLDTQLTMFALLLSLAVIANLLYAVRLWRNIHKPLSVLSGALRRVEAGELKTRIHHSRNDEFADIYTRFNNMTLRLDELIEQVYKQTIRTQRAELKQLQSQINPHFLYNSFFMIKSFSRMGDCEAIERLADELGEYFRYVTRDGEESVTLYMEIAHARNYAQIQDMRFSSRIRLTFPPAPEAFKLVKVPRLIMQPLIENAYGHGLSGAREQSELRVAYEPGGDYTRVIVEDSGKTLSDEALSKLQAQLTDGGAPETTGLINIHRRLKLRFGENYGLALSRGELGGLRVVMTLPAKEGNI